MESLRAQRVQDHFGYLILACAFRVEVGEVIQASGTLETPLVIVGLATRADYEAECAFLGAQDVVVPVDQIPLDSYYYKAKAE